MKKYLFILAVLFSCKKEQQMPKNNPSLSINYETITYKCYGTHNYYEIQYLGASEQSMITIPPDSSNKNWSYIFTDTIGGWRHLEYHSSIETGTMTAIIQINGITKDSITMVAANCNIMLNH